ncbi:MAG: hypothetical protein JNN03_05595 [Rubrivivax sp.]|nr:hypothetical protein [Rubrivivax sp.]
MRELNADLEAVLAELREETGWLAKGESAYLPHYWNLHKDDQPKALRSPDEYASTADLAIRCTQLDLPAAQQRKLVAQWVQALPAMQGVRRLWFNSRMSQELFDAACRIEGLEDLWIHWSGIGSLQAVAGLRGLKRFHLGQSASVASLEPLAGMSGLQWLFLAGMSKVPGLEPLATLSGLEGLFVAGNESKPLVVPTLAPLAKLHRLRWLHLGALRIAHGGLEPLAELRGLEYLGLPNFFSCEAFAQLAARLPGTRGDWLAPYARQHPSVFTCGRCRQRGKVLTAGAPGRNLCPGCDAEVLARHVLRYRVAQRRAAGTEPSQAGPTGSA